ncbi:MAG TPA: Asp-tRNA(Asn)/Glu-tRNA(Gln) amidotransferase subunit GatB [Candidatus Eisenbacteria bacterium]|nr:Asp-tRNA(Asn)/Glu-tRNA(Gln) amidotransferase subunit GatB [Candidatus Eisenbacteria bacterium]
MRFEPVIGLEIHVQLKTKTKMFCRCSNRGEYEAPNTCVCPVCLGQPGSLPVINAKAVEFGVLVGLALGGNITHGSKFDRKQYFYPDLPKGYQISQYDLPVVKGGALNVAVPIEGGQRRDIRVRIHRAHLEEDAAKLVHADDGTASFVDFNRGGTPLIEIVTEPDMRSPAEAKAFLQELRLIMRYLGVSDADMEKGHLRCDANVSIREEGTDTLNPKTEVKNINSFRSVERALDFEIKRQTKLALDGKPVTILTTRGWDDVRGITVEQRTKEGASDYRYFPEPDLPPLMLHELADSLASRVPELPEQRRARFKDEYGFSDADSRTFCDDKELGDYAEKVMSELQAWVASKAEGDGDKHWAECREPLARLAAGWILTKLGGVMTERKIDIKTLKTTPEDFAELLAMLHRQEVTGPNALIILEEMVESGADPSIILKEKNLGQMDDTEELRLVAGEVIVGNPKVVADWKSGKTNAVQFLVGQMMKTTRGKAPPETARKLIEEELKKVG